jgi:hypothetical protein
VAVRQYRSGVGKIENLYSALIRRNREAEGELPVEVRRNVAPNGLRLVLANALQSSGDQSVNASTVLPWLFAVLGVPSALIGLLVPIRESGSMLPQAFLTPLVLRIRRRKWVFVTGALVQAAAVAAMAATAALGEGLGAGIAIITALAIFSLGRCLCSISSKDVQGRTVPKGERGQINGVATATAGLVAITLGVTIRLTGEDLAADELALLLGAGAALWVIVAVVYASIREPVDDLAQKRVASDDPPPHSPWFVQMGRLLRDDKPFRSFVMVRSLLLVSALSPPFVVSLSIKEGSGSLAGLGGFIVAAGLASLLGGRIFGRLADRSSRRLMSVGAGIASAIIVVSVLIAAMPGFNGESVPGTLVFIGSYFLLTLTHTGVRVGRKTYIVDMAEGDLRTAYTAVSNSAMGVILLLVGGISSLFAIAHIFWALLFLAALGIVGVFAGTRLPEVSRR